MSGYVSSGWYDGGIEGSGNSTITNCHYNADLYTTNIITGVTRKKTEEMTATSFVTELGSEFAHKSTEHYPYLIGFGPESAVVAPLKITPSAGTNGYITPDRHVMLNKGDDKTFTFTPDEGYEIDTVKVDGSAVEVTGNTYTIINITDHMTIDVTFKKIVIPTTHTITASAGTNGLISPNKVVTVNDGDDKTFTFTPDEGYKIDTVKVDGSAVEITGNTYTITNITNDMEISVEFVEIPVVTPSTPEEDKQEITTVTPFSKDDETKNPTTDDNILGYISSVSISLIGIGILILKRYL